MTLKMESILPMFRAVLGLLQTCTDLLQKNSLLLEPVSPNLRVKTNAVIP